MVTTQRAASSSGPQSERELRASQSASAKHSRPRRLSIDAAILLACALIGAFGTKAFVGQIFSIPSDSMQMTVSPGERVFAEKVSYRFRSIERGDVVVFDGKGIFNEPAPGATMFVKRVVGLPGERIACCDASGKLTVDGVALDESQYLFPGDVPSSLTFSVRVPVGKLWLMGDHRSDSADSRAYLGAPGGGFVPEERVVGRAMAVVWPLSSGRSIDSPTYRR